MRSTASSGSPVQMKREAACSSSSSSARRASSRGSSTPCLASAGSASGAQKRQSATAVARSAAYESLISIMRSIAGGIGSGLLGARGCVRQQPLGVELARLARGRDQTALGAREAGALGPARGDPDGDRLRRQVVDHGAAGAVPLALEVHLLARPELVDQGHGLAQALEPLARAGPVDAGGRDLVHRLAGAEAEEDAARGEAAERREGLRDDRRVIAIGRRENARADEDARGLRGQRAEPRQRCGRVPAVVPERLEVVRDGDAVEAEALGGDAEREQLARARTARRTPCSRGAVGEGGGSVIDSARW